VTAHRAGARRPLRRSVVILLVAAGVVLGACNDDSKGTTRSATGQVVNPATISVFELKPADCLDPPPDLTGEINDIKVVPCTQPHTQEVFATVASAATAYPGAEALATEGSAACVGAMQAPGLGLSPDDGYFWSYLLPSFDGWNKDKDRSIVCVLTFPTMGEVTGSVVEQAKAGKVAPGSPPPVSAVPTTIGLGDTRPLAPATTPSTSAPGTTGPATTVADVATTATTVSGG
jgi:hypothetical protein